MLRTICAALTALAFAAAAQAQDLPQLAPAREGASPEELLESVARPSRHMLALEEGRLAGEGGDFLRARTADAQFVLFGEDHGNRRIAGFATALWRELAAQGFRYAAIEVDPWSAAALEREMRAGGVEAWRRFLAANGGPTAAPFYSWTDEAAFASAVVEASDKRPALWGLDQVFLGSAPWLLRDIAARTRNPEARATAERLAASADGNLEWLGKVEEAELQGLRALLTARRDAEPLRLVDAMIASSRIYRPFTGGAGEALIANDARERMMKASFLAAYEAAERRDRAEPRVMLKFGAYHMYRGASPTMVQALGGFVSAHAEARGRTTFSLYTVCGPGSFNGMLVGLPNACDADFNENWAFLAPYIERDKLTLFDLRVWRMRPRRWKHLSAGAQQAIASFDALVVFPNAPPQTFLPGLAAP